MMMLTRGFLPLFLFFAGGVTTNAAVLLADDFKYPDGALIDVSPNVWAHHSPASSGTGQVVVASERVLLTQSNQEDVSALLAGQPYDGNSATHLYVGFRVIFTAFPTQSGEYFAHLKPSGTSGFRARVFATTNTAAAGFLRLGLANAAAAPDVIVPVNLSLNTSYDVVIRYALSSVGSTIWIDPVAETDAGFTATDAGTVQTITSLALRQSLSSGNGMGSLFIDDIRVATTFSEAMPGPATPIATTIFSVLHYNVSGNGAPDWSTNSTQVRAIGRQLQYLQPDIVTFNEIPVGQAWQMPNFISAFLPGYQLATNSGTDGYICSVIASRFPILSSQKWLDGVSLAAFGYNGSFTRDLFQARVAVPGLTNPLSVFTTHLKATTSSPQNDANRRAAEASAISNFFVTTYLVSTNARSPYLLTGDLNEDIFRPDTARYTSGLPIQHLVSAPTGLRLTTPLNAYSASDLTLSIRTTLDVRFDYILPCGALFSNIASSQVFRSDLLPAAPAPLLKTDSATASDHLPVMMVFNLPGPESPFRILSLWRTNDLVTVSWQTAPGGAYNLESSADLRSWDPLVSALVATGAQTFFSTNIPDSTRFFRVSRQLP